MHFRYYSSFLYGFLQWQFMVRVLMVNLRLTTAANILLIPYPFMSHVASITTIGTTLKARGHHVSILFPSSYPDVDKVRVKVDVVVEYAVKNPDFYSKNELLTSWVLSAKAMTPIEEFRANVDGFIEFCTNPLEDVALPGKLEALKIDLAIVDGFPGSWCMYAIMWKLRIPYVSMTTEYTPWMWRNPALPSFVPFPLAGVFTERMTFAERIQNLITWTDWMAWPRVPYMEDSFLRRYLPEKEDETVTYSTLAARSLLWLIDTDVAIDYARPTMPNEVHIGGLSTRPAGPLPDDVDAFVRRWTKAGIVVVSFGSTGILDDDESFEILLRAFARLDQGIVWKCSNEVPTRWKDEVPVNVKIMKWLPQNDLLGHPACRLFVTHCGANSQFEALYHGIPMLGIPVFGDQPYNARRAEYKGYGTFLYAQTLTSDRLVLAVTEMLKNASYAENIKRGSAIFRDRVQTPMDRAAWWVEHVMRHGGRHVHSIALDMPWYEYLMLDIALTLVVLPLVMMTAIFSCCCTCIYMRGWRRRNLCSGNDNKIKQN